MGDSELEIKHIAASHMNFYNKSGNPCHLYIKNQGKPSHTLAPNPSFNKETLQPLSYMARVKENFARAWQKWDASEDLQLIEHFNARKELDELVLLHQRAPGGIVARLKKLSLLNEQIDFQQASKLLAKKHEKLIKLKAFGGGLKVKEIGFFQPYVNKVKDSHDEVGVFNKSPVPNPDLKHTSLFACSICNKDVVGYSCMCRVH